MTGTLEVGDLFLSLGAHGIERQRPRVGQPGLRLDDCCV
jgi:hypothetical protein